jgi:hypothetical protein
MYVKSDSFPFKEKANMAQGDNCYVCCQPDSASAPDN